MTSFGPELERLVELAPGVRRLLAPNPSMMTGPGTNTYLFGRDEIGVLDPGPVLGEHLQRIIDVAGAPIRYILVTHTHPDHSPGARELGAATGAELLGRSAPEGEHQDTTFQPDRVLENGDRIDVDGIVLEAVHTPGHASNHLCFHHLALDWVFTGDHVIDGSTVVINPPDGDMSAYIESLGRLKDLDCRALAPGHGDLIDDPERVIDWIIAHRLEREGKVLAALRAHPGLSAGQLVPHVYADVAEHLFGLAERSLLAHLLKLRADGKADCDDNRWLAA